MLRGLYILITLLCASLASAATYPPIRMRTALKVEPDSADLAYYGHKRWTNAVLQTAGLNLTVWAYDRYVQNADFAHISLHSIKENFRHWLIWDNDLMSTNMFLHPYHGGLYYNAARSNGFNYWQSGLFALGGSAMWEFFMENEYPSTNDIIATPIGGMVLGEVTYRGSDLVLNDETTGWDRFGREALAFVISPMRGLTRVLTGDAWRRRATPGRQFGIPNLAFEVSAGVRALEFHGPFFDTGVGFTSQFNFEYGDRFELNNPAPYDYFALRADINVQSEQPLLDQLNIMGRLLGRDLVDTPTRSLNVGMYQHFDYYDSDTISAVGAKVPYRMATPASFGCGLMYREIQPDRWTLDAFAHVNAVILGAILTDYYNVSYRSYNLGSGFSAKLGFNVAFDRNRYSVSLLSEYFRMFTWKGYPDGTNFKTVNERTLNAQGDPSVSSFIVAEGRFDYRLWKRLYASALLSIYYRSTHYNMPLPDVKSTTTATRIMLTYKF